MSKKSIAAFAFVTFSMMSSLANAATTVSIDAYSHCFYTDAGTGTTASFQLAPGRYVVSLVNDKMSCSNGILTGGCLIDSVVVRTTAMGTARWGVAVSTKAPTVIDVPGSGNANFVAFVVDGFCEDNVGTADLRFQLAK